MAEANLRPERADDKLGQRQNPAGKGKPKRRKFGSSRTYRAWSNMVRRCTDPRHDAYHRYGGRGIRICPEWLESFQAFHADMGTCPGPDLQLDRIDNDGNYEPGNCRWATKLEQANNTCANKRVTAFGRTRTIAQWARELGITDTALRARLSAGTAPEAALVPGRIARRFARGETHHLSRPVVGPDGRHWPSMNQACSALGLSKSSLLRWCKQGRNGWRFA